MRNVYQNIFLLYFRNVGFRLLAVILLMSAIISKALFMIGQPFYAEDFTTVLFVMTLWLALYFGLMIKRQFATHRASLLPGYRTPHIYAMGAMFAFFVIAAIAWQQGFRLLIEISPDGLQGVYITCFFSAILIAYLGYLSIGRIFIYVYVLVLLGALNVSNIIAAFENWFFLKYLIVILGSAFTVLFVQRLRHLKENHFEYHYLISWQPKQYFANQMKASEWKNPLASLFRIPSGTMTMPLYPREKNAFSRSGHWDYMEKSGVKIVMILFLLAAPLYLLAMKNYPQFAVYFKNIYSNFLLLSMTPILITMGTYYKKMAYWEFDLMRPVSKQQYLWERGVVYLLNFCMYWFVLIVCFAVFPAIINRPEMLTSGKFFGFLLLTGTFALLVMAWLTWLSCSSNAKEVIFHAFVIGSVILLQYYCAPGLTSRTLVYVNGICLCGGIMFLRKAYLAWCQKEVN